MLVQCLLVWPVVSNSVGKVICVLIQDRSSSNVSCHIFCCHMCTFSDVYKAFFATMHHTTADRFEYASKVSYSALQHSSFKPYFNAREKSFDTEPTPNWLSAGKLPYTLYT